MRRAWGAREVALPVVIAALTSMVMLASRPSSLPGVMQQGRPVPVVVIACLGFSLVECLLVLPAHLATSTSAVPAYPSPGTDRPAAGDASVQGATTQCGLERFIDEIVQSPAARPHCETAALTLASALALLDADARARRRWQWIPFTFLPKAESDYVTAVLTMPEGARRTRCSSKRPRCAIERAALQLRERARQPRASAKGRSAVRPRLHVDRQPAREAPPQLLRAALVERLRGIAPGRGADPAGAREAAQPRSTGEIAAALARALVGEIPGRGRAHVPDGALLHGRAHQHSARGRPTPRLPAPMPPTR